MTQEAGRVRIGERLRQDALGDWLRAERDGAPFTLRILREDLAGREDARMLFEEEIRRISRLDHPGLLRVHHLQRKPPRPWMLTDSIEGRSLETVVTAQGPLPASARLAATLLDAFAYLEARRQVHAAPIPARLVEVGAQWRLLTFRDVRAWDELKSLKGKAWPAPAFAPPEHAKDHPEPLRPLPFLAWTLGALLRFAAGGGPPREAGGAAAPLPEGFPAELAASVARLTAWDPAARPQGIDALRATLAGSGPAGGPPEAPILRRAPVPKRKRGR